MRNVLKPGLVLLIVSVIAAVLLGYVYEITKEPIAKQDQLAKETALKAVLPSAQSFKEGEFAAPEGTTITTVFTGLAGDDAVGYVLGVAPKGYSGAIEFMVGISKDGVVQGISILKHSETPGLGANAPQPFFADQFKNKNSQIEVVKSAPTKENQIQALTGATITSKAVAKGVNDALDWFANTGKGGVK